MKSLAISFVALALLSACSEKMLVGIKTEPPAKYSMVPDFDLVERSNRKVTRQELTGKVWVADFIFTTCGGICPVMTSNMRKLQDKLFADIRLVSFTVDPTHDTPEVLTEYANRYGANKDRWLFLTGDPEAI
jgi:protein SCO1/2